MTSCCSTEEDLWCSCDLTPLYWGGSLVFMWPQFSPDTFRMFWLAACWRVSHNHTDWPVFWGRYSNSGHLTAPGFTLYEPDWRILSSITSRGSYVPHLKPKVEGPLALKSPVSCYRSNKSFKMKWNCAKCIWSLWGWQRLRDKWLVVTFLCDVCTNSAHYAAALTKIRLQLSYILLHFFTGNIWHLLNCVSILISHSLSPPF